MCGCVQRHTKSKEAHWMYLGCLQLQSCTDFVLRRWNPLAQSFHETAISHMYEAQELIWRVLTTRGWKVPCHPTRQPQVPKPRVRCVPFLRKIMPVCELNPITAERKMRAAKITKNANRFNRKLKMLKWPQRKELRCYPNFERISGNYQQFQPENTEDTKN